MEWQSAQMEIQEELRRYILEKLAMKLQSHSLKSSKNERLHKVNDKDEFIKTQEPVTYLRLPIANRSQTHRQAVK